MWMVITITSSPSLIKPLMMALSSHLSVTSLSLLLMPKSLSKNLRWVCPPKFCFAFLLRQDFLIRKMIICFLFYSGIWACDWWSHIKIKVGGWEESATSTNNKLCSVLTQAFLLRLLFRLLECLYVSYPYYVYHPKMLNNWIYSLFTPLFISSSECFWLYYFLLFLHFYHSNTFSE